MLQGIAYIFDQKSCIFQRIASLISSKTTKIKGKSPIFWKKCTCTAIWGTQWLHIINIIKLQVLGVIILFTGSKKKFPRSRNSRFKMATIIHPAQCAQIAKYWKKFLIWTQSDQMLESETKMFPAIRHDFNPIMLVLRFWPKNQTYPQNTIFSHHYFIHMPRIVLSDLSILNIVELLYAWSPNSIAYPSK